MKIHIFNPENDMALASGSPGYTPPANIKAYRKQNWELPKLWAAPNDVVWDGESSLKHLFEAGNQVPELCPWGWSPALVHDLELAGVPTGYLPCRDYLEQLRHLSSRVSTVLVQQALGIDARVCISLEQVEESLEQWGKVIMKSPWSSSGKGLMQVDNPNWGNWVKRVLHQQGSVVVERLVENIQDFAMEFWLQEGKAEYLGINVFQTDTHGHFISNKPGSEEENLAFIKSMLAEPHLLDSLCHWYKENLPLIAPWYDGPVGVDMLVTGDAKVHSCVEINWRMTMGMVAVMTRGDEANK